MNYVLCDFHFGYIQNLKYCVHVMQLIIYICCIISTCKCIYILCVGLDDDLDSDRNELDGENSDNEVLSDDRDEEISSADSPVSVGSKRKQSAALESSVKRIKVSENYSFTFSQLLPKIYELLEKLSAKLLILILSQLRVDQPNMISLFSSKDLKDYDESVSAATVLKTLRHCWRWYDFSLLRLLLKTSGVFEAVKLLDDFGSSIDFSQPLSAYPVPTISSSFEFDQESCFTVLATKVEKNCNDLTFQKVHQVKSLIMEKFEIMEHSIQLMAVNTNPTVLYWMIPKCVASIISAKVLEQCRNLHTNDISEIAIFPNTIVATDGTLEIGSLTYFSASFIVCNLLCICT